jgi:PPOX class probable F420-dependent enzyme
MLWSVDFDAKARTFLEKNHGAGMVTLRADGTPHVVRIGVALVDGKLWSSGTQRRARTRHLRRDPRAALFVFEQQGFGYLGIEARVTILEGDDVPELSISLLRTMQAGMPGIKAPGNLMWNGAEVTPDQFRRAMIDEQRLIYQFEPVRTYGLY